MLSSSASNKRGELIETCGEGGEGREAVVEIKAPRTALCVALRECLAQGYYNAASRLEQITG